MDNMKDTILSQHYVRNDLRWLGEEYVLLPRYPYMAVHYVVKQLDWGSNKHEMAIRVFSIVEQTSFCGSFWLCCDDKSSILLCQSLERPISYHVEPILP